MRVVSHQLKRLIQLSYACAGVLLVGLFACAVATTEPKYQFDHWTADGLARYDGLQFTIFNKSNTRGREIGSNRFDRLFENSRGALWSVTDSGWLVKYQADVLTNYTPKDGELSWTVVQSKTDIRTLEPSKPIERELALGTDHSYRITLVASQYLHVVVDQRDVDVVVTLLGPDGKQLSETNNLKRGTEAISLIASISGDYRLVVRSAESVAPLGRYVVSIRELRAATPQDRDRLATEQAAQQLMGEGKRLQVQGPGETLKQALEKYREALRLWQAAGNQRGAALALTRLGLIYDKLGEKQKALDFYQQAIPLWRAVDDRPMLGATLANIGMILSPSATAQRGPGLPTTGAPTCAREQ